MMQLFHIPPKRLASLIIPREVESHLCISSVILEDDGYREFYRFRKAMGDWITVDTPAFEGIDPDVRILADAAESVSAHEVVIPDLFRDAEGTVKRSTEAMQWFDDAGPKWCQFMVVPQGTDFDEYLECLQELASASERVRCIGIIEEVEEDFGMSRSEVISMVNHLYPSMQLHLLGVSEHLEELYEPEVVRTVRSCDTSKFIVWGLNDTFVDPHDEIPEYPGRQSLGGRTEYFNYRGATGSQLWKAKKNILRWRMHLNAHTKNGGEF